MMKSQPQESLFSRCTGPGAIALETLASRGEQAFATVGASYERFLLEKLANLSYMTKQCVADPHDTEAHTRLIQSACDIRTSASMAGRETVARFASFLEKVTCY